MRSAWTFFRRWENYLALVLVLTFIFVAVAAPMLAPIQDEQQGIFRRAGRASELTPHPPSENAKLGTLPGNIDVFYLIVWGTRSALQFGLLVAVIAFVLGVAFGAMAGYAGGLLNNVMMRVADAFLTFPVIAGVFFIRQIIEMAVTARGGHYYPNPASMNMSTTVFFFDTPDPFASFLLALDPVLIGIIVFSWMPVARLVNTMVMTIKNMEFVQAAHSIGGSPLWIIRKHLIPNSIGPAVVLATRDVGSAVILQATLTFIGMGGGAPWGMLLAIGRNWVIGAHGNLLQSWWIYLPATIVVILFGVGWNMLGDGIQAALEPHRQQ
jgi:peptide/nickel transport system permease protein